MPPALKMAKSACTHSARLDDKSAIASPFSRPRRCSPRATSRTTSPHRPPRQRLPGAALLEPLGRPVRSPAPPIREQPGECVLGHSSSSCDPSALAKRLLESPEFSRHYHPAMTHSDKTLAIDNASRYSGGSRRGRRMKQTRQPRLEAAKGDIMQDARKTQEMFMQGSGKIVEAMTVWSEANQRVVRELASSRPSPPRKASALRRAAAGRYRGAARGAGHGAAVAVGLAGDVAGSDRLVPPGADRQRGEHAEVVPHASEGNAQRSPGRRSACRRAPSRPARASRSPSRKR